ncbi:uncharacterized protein OCT59_003024 [Rhizophagus irregularis]|uniref:uncharacterized protein n=1 Tax=Rhizophagus irregularis TaxID=588596 RepID=UPI00332F012F|nr:hypothetical protein OCT59_003024 [Rhizophagus irregularis]
MWELASGVPIFYDIPDICEEHEPKTTRLPEAHHDVSRKLSSSSVISSSSVLIVTGKIMTSDNYDDCNDCMVQDEEK